MRQQVIHRTQRSGMSRLDALFALGVFTLLGLVFVPYILKLREQARATSCRDHLRSWVLGLNNYHDVHNSLPPAAVWNTHATHSLALHHSKGVERITHENWAVLLLPYLSSTSEYQQFNFSKPIGSPANIARTQPLPQMKCVSDHYNRADNPYCLHGVANQDAVAFARGNYAINGGTHNFSLAPPSTTRPQGDYVHLLVEPKERSYQLWGNGIAGINKSFVLDQFENGLSTLIAIEEVRAGIHPVDPRGVWSLGQIGGSITWAHGVNGDAAGPNNQWSRSDDIMGCEQLHEILGSETLQQEEMPCVSYIDTNQQATSRSLHPGGVHVALLDGSVKFISNHIDSSLWHVLHSRETPATFIREDLKVSTSKELNDEATSTASVLPKQRIAKIEKVFMNSIGMNLVYIPAGEFQMGLPDVGSTSRLPSESPVHQVKITKPYFMSAYEITNAQFLNITENVQTPANRNDDHEEPGNFPVTNISWDEANRFCERLSLRADEKRAGRSYRLPTEAEWEFACRSGKSAPYSWRESRPPDDQSGEAAGIEPSLPLTQVGAYPANAFGLYDMRGNAWEWTSDWYQRDYYSHSPESNPTGPTTGIFKVIRGSDWRFVGEKCFIDYPTMPPWKTNPVVGFRVVCEMNE